MNQNYSSETKKIFIEDFIDFDKNNLAEYKILYSLFGKRWYWFYNSSVALSVLAIFFGFSMLLFSKSPNFLWLLLAIPGTTAIFFLVKAYHRRLAPIVKACNCVYNLKIKPNYDIFKDKMVILKIQNVLLNEYVKNNYITLSDVQIRAIIEALKYETSNISYSYQSLTISISFLTIILAAFLSSWFRVTTNFKDFINIAIKSGIFLMIVSFVFFYLEENLIKDFIRNKRNKFKRLIGVLENYILNLAEKK